MSDTDQAARDAGFDEWLDALADDDPYYLACPDGHGSLPPRRVCPVCGSQTLEQRPLPETGRLETYTITYIPTPSFAEDAPYATAIVDFGPVRLTGQVVDTDFEALEPGLEVTPAVTTTETTGNRLLVFRVR